MIELTTKRGIVQKFSANVCTLQLFTLLSLIIMHSRNLFALKKNTRRLQFDLTTVYKIIYGVINVDAGTFFILCPDSRTRGHKFKIATTYSRLDVRKYFFSSRVVPTWNALPATCNVTIFKSELSKYLRSVGAR